ncbi:MAG TPA: glycerol-3-phosphate 1-O-acyltransferase PlsY [Candidatus Krumholzibacteria bacterium]|nr:glycerol-3-phosphate 1-O-acyltransferase PlsY [Candidatus Krumholzibacteria bacterium]HPD71547.1 glycerol-3-phosphate 1-O-acyltransferase PlsY [Candidatus Krumholzibacteria bacterium]HRY41520.1 glycerol-3-phosphate 1-O-acyltransferase PlsY [Candidatus Krumholzibacteria bacterium]
MWIIVCLVLAYLVGAIPFSLIIGLKVKGIDLREHGSGNLGATNVYRNLGAGWGGLCLVLDMAKGAAAVLAMTAVVNAWPADVARPLQLAGDSFRILAGLLAILGHSFSPFAGFRGGKGIATTFGVFLILEPFPVLVAFGVFLIVFFSTRIVSLGSVCAAAVFPFAVLIFEIRSTKPYSKTLIVFSAVMAILVLWRHRANIRRLKAGTEKPLHGPEESR